jgi:hypothetical protein
VADGVGDALGEGAGEVAEAGVGELVVFWALEAVSLAQTRMATAPRRVNNRIFLRQFGIV